MTQQPEPSPGEQGRTDSPHDLLERLASAPAAYLMGALDNPALDNKLVEVMLRNQGLPEPALLRLGQDERLLKSDEIKAALVNHPATPRAISMHLVKFLPWRDLAAIGTSKEVAPAIRTLAEQSLTGRLNQIPGVEKSKLARTGGRSILTALFRSRDLRIIPELLRNPRVAERDVTNLTRDHATPSTLLGAIARDEKWCHRTSVRLSLIENPSTPLSDTLRLLPALPTLQLRKLRQNPRLPSPLRNEAAKLLQNRQKRR